MDFSNLLHESVNVVDIYICPRGAQNNGDWASQIGWATPSSNIPSFGGGKGSLQHFIEYFHRELCYVYDTANDGQRVLKRTVLASQQHRPFVAYAYQEDQLPSHKYPCVSELTHKQEIQRTTFRINNRLSFIIDIECPSDSSSANENSDRESYTYYYIRYQHAHNVDTKKIEEDVKYALNNCKRTLCL